MTDTTTLSFQPARREALTRGGKWLAGTAAVIWLSTARPAKASKVAKQDFFYQERPKEGKRCGTCRMYSINADGRGMCAVVDGEISADGWCIAYAARE